MYVTCGILEVVKNWAKKDIMKSPDAEVGLSAFKLQVS